MSRADTATNTNTTDHPRPAPGSSSGRGPLPCTTARPHGAGDSETRPGSSSGRAPRPADIAPLCAAPGGPDTPRRRGSPRPLDDGRRALIDAAAIELARAEARRAAGRGRPHPAADLESAAMWGLIDAAARWDARRRPYLMLARYAVRSAIRDEMRAAAPLGYRARDARPPAVLSLDAPTAWARRGPRGATLAEAVAAPDSRTRAADRAAELVAGLPDGLRPFMALIYLRPGEPMPIWQAARLLGWTLLKARREHDRAIEIMRRMGRRDEKEAS